MYIERDITQRAKELLTKFPVLLITGPRQSGKTYFVKKKFSNFNYISLEDIDLRTAARTDPRGFLESLGEKVIFDEIQRAPELLSYIQTRVDRLDKNSIYILTGSHQLYLMNNISQSLSGRVAILNLLPFSLQEIKDLIDKNNSDEILIKGFYPRIYDHNIEPSDFYSSYIATYIERDVRALTNIKDLTSFETFIKLLSGRTAQILNLSSIGNDCGVSHNTIKNWISILEASYIIYRLKPYYKNIRKRLIKTPKIHLIDPGIVSYLLGIKNISNISFHPLKGNIFETMVFSEILKTIYNKGLKYDLSYYRDIGGKEIDVIIEGENQLALIEIKSSKTISNDFFKSFKNTKEIFRGKQIFNYLIYAGEYEFVHNNIKILNYLSINKIFENFY